MTLEKYRSGGSLRYRLDGKRISASQAKEILASNPDVTVVDNSVITRELCPDRLAAIKQIEAATQTTFFVDHTVKIEGGVFAQDDNGATLELRNDSVSFKTASGKVTIFELDIPESKFIDALNCATIDALDNSHELETFTITGNSGKVYTYDANTLEVISVDEPVVESEESEVPAVEAPAEKLVDFIINQRRSIQAAFIKNRPAKVA